MAAEDLEPGPLCEDRRWQSNYSSCLSGWRSAASASRRGKTQTGFQTREEDAGREHTPSAHDCGCLFLRRGAQTLPSGRHELPLETITKSPKSKNTGSFITSEALSFNSSLFFFFLIPILQLWELSCLRPLALSEQRNGRGRKRGSTEAEREGSQSCKELKSLLETLVSLQTERQRRLELPLYLLSSLWFRAKVRPPPLCLVGCGLYTGSTDGLKALSDTKDSIFNFTVCQQQHQASKGIYSFLLCAVCRKVCYIFLSFSVNLTIIFLQCAGEAQKKKKGKEMT